MALLTVTAAKGAPGATTTAALLAALWPRPTVLVDADPAGGDLALRLPAADGRPLDRERGLLSLLPSARRGLVPGMVLQHTQEALGGQLLLSGLTGPEQALAVGPLWQSLATGFAALPEHDVVVDAGQVHARSAHLSLVDQAAAVLWVYRPTAWSVVHTRQRLETLAGSLAEAPLRVGVLCVADARQAADAEAAAATLTGDWRWVTDYGTLAADPKGVVMFEGGVVYRPERTLLARSGRALAARLAGDLARDLQEAS